MSVGILRWGVVLTLALILMILPLPAYISASCPPWILVCLLYAVFFCEWSLHPIYLIGLGLLLDALQASVLGEHIFALSFALWIATLKRWRFAHFSMNQQMILVGLIVWLYQISLMLIVMVLGQTFNFWPWVAEGILSAILSAICWNWIKIILCDFLTRSSKHAV